MDEFDAQLRELVAKTCKHANSSIERQHGLTAIVRMIVKSGKLWKDNSPYYEDALQKTWLYFCRNLCEANTGEQYDPKRSSVITWLNAYLQRRLQDFRIQQQQEQAQRVLETNEAVDQFAVIAAPPDIPPMLEMTKNWAETDADDELKCIHIQGHPHINCQVLILQRLPPETSWEALSEKYNVSVSTLTSFYRRQCIPRLRNFGELQGYL